jgi:hypothetical protein
MAVSSTRLPNRTSLFAIVSGVSFLSRRTRREGILRLISTVCVIGRSESRTSPPIIARVAVSTRRPLTSLTLDVERTAHYSGCECNASMSRPVRPSAGSAAKSSQPTAFRRISPKSILVRDGSTCRPHSCESAPPPGKKSRTSTRGGPSEMLRAANRSRWSGWARLSTNRRRRDGSNSKPASRSGIWVHQGKRRKGILRFGLGFPP